MMYKHISILNKQLQHLVSFYFTVPIIPEFLYDIRHPDAPLSSFPKSPPPTLPPCDHKSSSGSNNEITTIGYGMLTITEAEQSYNSTYEITNHFR